MCAVGRDFGFGEAVGGAESFYDGVDFGGGWFFLGFEAFLDVGFCAGGLWRSLCGEGDGAEEGDRWREFAGGTWGGPLDSRSGNSNAGWTVAQAWSSLPRR